ncbi:MAG: hypothetical protein R3E66_20860 [bacterium]
MNRAVPFVVLLGSLLTTSAATARSFRVNQIPNGATFSCLTCHNSQSGRGENAFGRKVGATLLGSNVNWLADYAADSDGDGYSNGLELGDPEGFWTTGQASPPGMVSNPGVASSTLCGDGILNGPEECDGDAMGAVCPADQPGTVICTALCKLDFSGCGAAPANNQTNNQTTNQTNNQTNNGQTTSTNNSTTAEPSNTDGQTNQPPDSGVVVILDQGTDDSGCTEPGLASPFLFSFLALWGIRRR